MKNGRSALLALAAALALTAAAAAQADTVTLLNGDRLSGKVLHKSGNVLTFQTTYAGKIKIRWSEVRTLTTDSPVGVMLEGEPEPRPLVLTPDNVEPGRIAYINPLPEESGRGVTYKGRVALAASAVRGNSSTSSLHGEGAFTARAKDYRYGLMARVDQAKDAGQTVTSNWRMSGHYDHFLAPKRFVYGRGFAERDRFRDIKLRTSAGAGYGWQIYDTDRTQLAIRGGVDAVSVKHNDGSGEDYPALGWGLQYSHRLWQRKVELFHHQEGFWNLRHTEQVTLHTSTGLRVPLSSGMTANAQVDLDWDRTPPPGIKAVDTTWLLGLGYEW
jgi:putative salt-induced outer membrane protein YdiY